MTSAHTMAPEFKSMITCALTLPYAPALFASCGYFGRGNRMNAFVMSPRFMLTVGRGLDSLPGH